jgi:hypothetical protein
MPRYYFNLDDTDHVTDPDGTELPNDTDARAHATLVMRELMHQSAGILGALWVTWTMRVCNKDGKMIHLIPFAEIPKGLTN